MRTRVEDGEKDEAKAEEMAALYARTVQNGINSGERNGQAAHDPSGTLQVTQYPGLSGRI